VYGSESTGHVGTLLTEVLTDALWVVGLEKCRSALARSTTVYSYQTFDPDAPESHVHAHFSAISAGHDSALPALFQWDDFTGEPPRLSAEQHEFAVQLGHYWGQFAATGDPNGVGLPIWRPTKRRLHPVPGDWPHGRNPARSHRRVSPTAPVWLLESPRSSRARRLLGQQQS